MSQIVTTLEALFEPGMVFEVRVLHKRDGRRATHSGYYTLEHSAQAEQFAKKFNKLGDQVYVTLNPVNPEGIEDLGIGYENVTRTTTDAMIAQRRWLPLDFDPVRAPGTSATTAQVDAAERMAQEVCTHLSQQGWPEPIIAESGNGVHLLYAVDLPANDVGLLKAVLQQLSINFSTEEVQLDKTLSNASRIIKLYGTISQKGETKRITRITNLPDRSIVSLQQLREVAGVKEDAETVQVPKETPYDFDLDGFLERAGLSVKSRGREPDGRARFVLNHCYFDPSHSNGEVAIFMSPNGKMGYHCFHNSCFDHDWNALRAAVDGTPTERALKHFEIPEPKPTEFNLGLLPHVTSDKRNESANADRIATLAAGRLLYLQEKDEWAWFDDKEGWAISITKPMEIAIAAATHILVQAQDLPDPKDAAAAAQWYKTSLGATALKHAVELASFKLAVSVNDFDADPYLVAVRNGVIDLRNGSFRPHSIGDRMLRRMDVDYNPNATCERWESTIDSIFKSQKDLVHFMQRAFGYSMTGLTRETKLMFAYGFGANGKSTVLNVLREIAGSYSAVVQTEVFMDSGKGGNASPEVAGLAGARVVVAQETDENATLKASLVKQLTGGDAIAARHLYGKPFTFTPQFQVWLSGNHKPIVSGSDFGVWRRMTLIPFERRYEASEQIRNLNELLRVEYSGILNWIVAGAVAYFKYGLGVPSDIERATEDYKSDMDHIGRWLSEKCEGSPSEFTLAKDLWHHFLAWARENGHSSLAKMSQTTFGNKLRERGIEKVRKTAGISYPIKLLDGFGLENA